MPKSQSETFICTKCAGSTQTNKQTGTSSQLLETSSDWRPVYREVWILVLDSSDVLLLFIQTMTQQILRHATLWHHSRTFDLCVSWLFPTPSYLFILSVEMKQLKNKKPLNVSWDVYTSIEGTEPQSRQRTVTHRKSVLIFILMSAVDISWCWVFSDFCVVSCGNKLNIWTFVMSHHQCLDFLTEVLFVRFEAP